MATVREIAEHSGVSIGTISNYMNGVKVKDSTALKIKQALQDLSSVRVRVEHSQQYNIGICNASLEGGYNVSMLASIQQYATDNGHNLFFLPSLTYNDEAVQTIGELKIDGLIIKVDNSRASEDIKSFNNLGIPIVVYDSGVDNYACDQVLVDNINGAYAAVEHLLSYGHRRIGMLAYNEVHFTSNERERGYKRALRDYLVEADKELIVHCDRDQVDVTRAIDKFLSMDDPPTALFCANYYNAMYTARALIDRGISVPAGMSVVGFDDVNTNVVLGYKMTVVAQPIDEYGRTIIEMIVRRMQDKEYSRANIVRLKTTFIIGNSVRVCESK